MWGRHAKNHTTYYKGDTYYRVEWPSGKGVYGYANEKPKTFWQKLKEKLT